MIIFVSEFLDKVLTQGEYANMLRKEVAAGIYEDCQRAYESDTVYDIVITRVSEGFISELYNIDNLLMSDLYGDAKWKIVPSMCDNISDTIENLSYSYKLTNNWYLNVSFEIVKLDEENLEDSIVKVTKIELI